MVDIKYFKIKQGDFCYYLNDLQKQSADNIIQEQKEHGYNYKSSSQCNIQLLRRSDFAVNISENTVIKLRQSVEFAFDRLLGIENESTELCNRLGIVNEC